MKHIINANRDILGILGKPRQTDAPMRLTKYCVALSLEAGVLLFNTLTRELLLLSQEEYAAAYASDYLREHWFTVAQPQDEKELAELVRWVQKSLRKEPEHITAYTILTTTDCNARCYYCYQRGCLPVSMTKDTAEKVVAYIKNSCGGQKITLAWFGGEPLVNSAAIDWICQGLSGEGIAYTSSMTSNGYLFTDDTVTKAKEIWKLSKIQITLDGTEAVYNRTKAYLRRQDSAYQVVLGNILRLLEADIFVSIRLNMDLSNAGDLMELAKELAVRFAGQKKLHVYAHLLMDAEKSPQERYTPQEWTRLYDALHGLEKLLLETGLFRAEYNRLRRDLPTHLCMADSGSSVLIAPQGQLGLCEHYPDREFFGYIGSSYRDKAVIESWRQRCEPIEACDDCFYYPECVALKKCHGRQECTEHERKALRRKTEQAMLAEFSLWKRKGTDNGSVL